MKVVVAVSCALILASLAGCGKSDSESRSSEDTSSQASADSRGAGDDSDDPAMALAVRAASNLKPGCKPLGDAIIRMATPNPKVDDPYRERRVQLAIDGMPENCIAD